MVHTVHVDEVVVRRKVLSIVTKADESVELHVEGYPDGYVTYSIVVGEESLSLSRLDMKALQILLQRLVANGLLLVED